MARLKDVSAAAKGEPAWPPLALFKALLITVWHDLSDVNWLRLWLAAVWISLAATNYPLGLQHAV